MTDNEIKKATENDIIKALEDWLKNFEGKAVDYMKIRFALDLIKRKNAEIERLKVENYQRFVQASWNGQLKTAIRNLAIQEFAERLKEKGRTVTTGHGVVGTVVDDWDIDNLVKEMVGENK